jgi:DNA-binding MarR family transcriptional regulator
MFTANSQASPEAQRLLALLNTLIGSTFRQILWRNAAELELTYAQAQVLFYVDQHPGCHMGKVAKTFNVTLPATTQIVDRLVQKHFLIRGTNPADRRVATLELTETGKALVRELQTLQVEGLEPILARMSAQDRSRLIEGLEVFVAAARRGSEEVIGA